MATTSSEAVYTFRKGVGDHKITIKAFQSGDKNIIVATIKAESVGVADGDLQLTMENTFKLGSNITEQSLTDWADTEGYHLNRAVGDTDDVLFDPAASVSVS